MTHTYIFTLPVDSFLELFLAFSGLDAAFEGHTSLVVAHCDEIVFTA